MAKKIKANDEQLYHIVVAGNFIPGLPAECSLKQARDLSVEEELQAAIENGTYILGPAPTPTQPPPNSESTNLGEEKQKE